MGVEQSVAVWGGLGTSFLLLCRGEREKAIAYSRSVTGMVRNAKQTDSHGNVAKSDAE